MDAITAMPKTTLVPRRRPRHLRALGSKARRAVLAREGTEVPSVKIDLMMVPISWVFSFTLFAGLAIGSSVVQTWLVGKFGHLPWTVSSAWVAVPLTVVFTLLGTDLARFAWHYQGHHVPFFSAAASCALRGWTRRRRPPAIC